MIEGCYNNNTFYLARFSGLSGDIFYKEVYKYENTAFLCGGEIIFLYRQ
jgi:hypothetical protein